MKCCKVILTGILAVITILAAATYLAGQEIFYVNRTASAPCGIYMRCLDDTLKYDDYVVVALDRDVAALKEGYLLLKQVKGFPGDVYIVDNRGVTIRGQFFPVKPARQLPQLKKGAYIVPKDSCLLLNGTDESFDSRYLGPMKRDRIRAKVRMLLPYGPLARLFAKG